LSRYFYDFENQHGVAHKAVKNNLGH
jgi:hypothetical protein